MLGFAAIEMSRLIEHPCMLGSSLPETRRAMRRVYWSTVVLDARSLSPQLTTPRDSDNSDSEASLVLEKGFYLSLSVFRQSPFSTYVPFLSSLCSSCFFIYYFQASL
jgi:hypothetical protein